MTKITLASNVKVEVVEVKRDSKYIVMLSRAWFLGMEPEDLKQIADDFPYRLQAWWEDPGDNFFLILSSNDIELVKVEEKPVVEQGQEVKPL